MKNKKYKYLILTVSIFLIVGLSSILLINNSMKDNNSLIAEEESSSFIENDYEGNLIIESDNNNVVTTEEEEEGIIRILPEKDGESVVLLPNPNTDTQVILKKL